MKEPEPKNACLHCVVNETISRFAALHSPLYVEYIIDDLSACICEAIASHPEESYREALAQQTASTIPERVRLFRKEGRFAHGIPVGPAVSHSSTAQLH